MAVISLGGAAGGLVAAGVLTLSTADPTSSSHSSLLVYQTTDNRPFIKQSDTSYEELPVRGTGIAGGVFFARKGSDPVQ